MNLTSLALVAAVVAATPLALQQSAKSDAARSVTLTRRKDNGPYGTSAYSFRYATQSLDRHGNDVDLVFNGCGNLHVAPNGGEKSRIVKVLASAWTDAGEIPAEGWKTESFAPEKNGVYVMEIDDGATRFHVRLRVTAVSDAEVRFEWAPFRDPSRATQGTLGQCGGKHDPS